MLLVVQSSEKDLMEGKNIEGQPLSFAQVVEQERRRKQQGH